jgi:23S rRNA pseudouridine1911/1915/1917 synthase
MQLPADPIFITVPPAASAVSAEQIARQLSGLAPEQVATIIARGGLWIDGRRALDGTQPALPGSRIALRTPPAGIYRDMQIAESDLLFEDEWLLAINKRPGCYVGATPWDLEGNVLAALGRFLAARDGLPPTLHLAHQLDRDTSGVLLLSKRPEVNTALHQAFANREARKRYLAICHGRPGEAGYDVRTGLGRGPGGGFYVYPLEQVGSRAETGRSPIREAHTILLPLAMLREAALVEALPRTGRTHQIRLHLAHLGHPVLGDTRYGGPSEHAGEAVPHHMLHAAELELPHPRGGSLLLRAEPAATFTWLLERLR